jgi:iron(III) transport system substrate-binding protein
MTASYSDAALSISRRHCLGLAVGLGAFAQASNVFAQASTEAILSDLITGAKKEGTLTIYSAATENVLKRTTDAFAAKYGVKCQYLRLSSGPLQQRFSTEADSGTIVADVILNAANMTAFGELGVRKGWLGQIASADLPVILSGEFPAKWARDFSTVVQIAPWLMAYNTDKVKAADAPKDWLELIDPKWQGEIILINPSVSDAYLDLWHMLLKRHGESFFTRLRAQKLRIVTAGNVAVQSLAAGEGSIALPQIPDSVRIIRNAPIGTSIPDVTTGVEMQVVLVSREKSKSPNAGRLFANFIMSREGNAVMNDDPAMGTIYSVDKLPSKYASPDPGAQASKVEIMKLFGLS